MKTHLNECLMIKTVIKVSRVNFSIFFKFFFFFISKKFLSDFFLLYFCLYINFSAFSSFVLKLLILFRFCFFFFSFSKSLEKKRARWFAKVFWNFFFLALFRSRNYFLASLTHRRSQKSGTDICQLHVYLTLRFMKVFELEVL